MTNCQRVAAAVVRRRAGDSERRMLKEHCTGSPTKSLTPLHNLDSQVKEGGKLLAYPCDRFLENTQLDPSLTQIWRMLIVIQCYTFALSVNLFATDSN